MLSIGGEFTTLQAIYIGSFWILIPLGAIGMTKMLADPTAKTWTLEVTQKTALSMPATIYHYATDFLLVFLLIGTGHGFLGGMKIISSFTSCLLIAKARNRMRHLTTTQE